MLDILRAQDALNRRTFLQGAGFGMAALVGMFGKQGLTFADTLPTERKRFGGLPKFPEFAPKAKRVIYLHQSGAPSHLDLYDYKPGLEKHRNEDLPSSIRNGQRLTGMTSSQARFPVAPTIFKFNKVGQAGVMLTEIMPHLSTVVDEMTFIYSMNTEAINHDPAITFFQTGSQLAGRPAMGSWLSYGLGTECDNLPAFVVLTSFGTGRKDDQPLYDRLWGSGFLPTEHQGVKFRATGDPVLYIGDPAGEDRATRREMLDDIAGLNKLRQAVVGDPEITTRISAYELAFRMQTSVPGLLDIHDEPEHILDMYGPEVKHPGTYAHNCLIARRLCERGVRFTQLFHMGWDQHFNLPKAIAGQCYDTDQASAALIKDLKQRGLLDETLIVWAGEFGRTVYSQGDLTMTDYGRDHHPRCFTVWVAGGGFKKGSAYGKTDDFGYNIVENPVSVHDLHATMMQLLGINHKHLTYRHEGRDYRLTDVFGNVVDALMA